MGLFNRESKPQAKTAQPTKAATASHGPHAGSFDCGCGAHFHSKEELQAHAKQDHAK